MADWGRKLAAVAAGERNGVPVSVYGELCTLYNKARLPGLDFLGRVFRYSQKAPVG